MKNMHVEGDLRAQRNAAAERFFGKTIKKAGSAGESVFVPMRKPLLQKTDAQIGSLPSGKDTVGGVVGGLKDSDNYQGVKARAR